MASDTAVKTCASCHNEKPTFEFSRAWARKDGFQPYCKACRHERRKAWQAAHPEEHREQMREQNARARRRQTDHWLRSKYGMTIADYEAMDAAQGHTCAICRRPPNGKGRLHVDHDHLSGEVRGLLCFTCNAALGYLGDDPTLILAAASYLKERS